MSTHTHQLALLGSCNGKRRAHTHVSFPCSALLASCNGRRAHTHVSLPCSALLGSCSGRRRAHTGEITVYSPPAMEEEEHTHVKLLSPRHLQWKKKSTLTSACSPGFMQWKKMSTHTSACCPRHLQWKKKSTHTSHYSPGFLQWKKTSKTFIDKELPESLHWEDRERCR